MADLGIPAIVAWTIAGLALWQGVLLNVDDDKVRWPRMYLLALFLGPGAWVSVALLALAWAASEDRFNLLRFVRKRE